MFKVGDIIKRLDTGDSYDKYNIFARRYPDYLFIIEEKIKSRVNNNLFVIMCLQTHDTYTVHLGKAHEWQKLS